MCFGQHHASLGQQAWRQMHGQTCINRHESTGMGRKPGIFYPSKLVCNTLLVAVAVEPGKDCPLIGPAGVVQHEAGGKQHVVGELIALHFQAQVGQLQAQAPQPSSCRPTKQLVGSKCWVLHFCTSSPKLTSSRHRPRQLNSSRRSFQQLIDTTQDLAGSADCAQHVTGHLENHFALPPLAPG